MLKVAVSSAPPLVALSPENPSSVVSLPQLIAESARQHPNAIAVRDSQQQWTYQQLLAHSAHYAHQLRLAGLTSESVVAVCLERNIYCLAALLGTWQAGGVYLAIDPACPAERRSFLLQDSSAEFILTRREYAGNFRDQSAAVSILDDWSDTTQNHPPDLDSFHPAPDALAYVLYTSGSTGQPKGVEICHSGLANVVTAVAEELELRPREVLLAHSSLNFDVSNLELYLSLISGGCCYIADSGTRADAARLIATLHESNATTMLGTPSLWRLLLDAGWLGRPDFRAVSGGEVLTSDLAQRLLARCGAVWNQYGPTECTICATSSRISRQTANISIGRPIANVTAHVLDAVLASVPDGVTGELYLGGAGVARGYRNRPDLTLTSFIPDFFHPESGARLYKTGDLVRQFAGGELDFVGRVDNQVKISGYRIELEEIEAQIRQFPGVEEAVVVPVAREIGGSRLLAWVQTRQEAPYAELKAFLKARLPAYMIPSEIRFATALPVNGNGKVDRLLLRNAHTYSASALSNSAQVLTPALQKQLQTIWQELLQVPIVQPHDNFFEIGGNSLLAASLTLRIQERLGYRLNADVLLEHPTIDSLAGHLNLEEHTNDSEMLLPLATRGAQAPPLFIVHGIGGTVLSFRELAAQLQATRPIYGVRLPSGPSRDPDALKIPVLASRCLREIRQLFPKAPYHLAGHSLGGLVAFEIASQLKHEGQAPGLLILLDSDRRLAQTAPDPSAANSRLTLAWSLWKLKLKALAAKGPRRVLTARLDHIRLHRRVRLAREALQKGSAGYTFDAKELLILAAADYRPAPYSGNAVLFRAAHEARNDVSGSLGWADLLGPELEVIDLPGNHNSIFYEPAVSSLADALQLRLSPFA